MSAAPRSGSSVVAWPKMLAARASRTSGWWRTLLGPSCRRGRCSLRRSVDQLGSQVEIGENAVERVVEVVEGGGGEQGAGGGPTSVQQRRLPTPASTRNGGRRRPWSRPRWRTGRRRWWRRGPCADHVDGGVEQPPRAVPRPWCAGRQRPSSAPAIRHRRLGGGLQRREVDLLHREHRLRGASGDAGVVGRDERVGLRRPHLPVEAELVLQPAALDS